MKKLNYVLCLLCLIGCFPTTFAWFKSGESLWVVLAGFLFLSGIIFFLFFEIEDKNEEISKLRALNFERYNQILTIKNLISSQ